MSTGLYSTDKKEFSNELNLKEIKPYGDTMNDGKTQLSFTLPVQCGDEAIEAAKQLMKKMGFENPQVVFYKVLTKGFTFFNCSMRLFTNSRSGSLNSSADEQSAATLENSSNQAQQTRVTCPGWPQALS